MCAPLAILALRGSAVQIRSMGELGDGEIAALLQIPRLLRAIAYLKGLGGNTAEMLRQADEMFGPLEDELLRSERASQAFAVPAGNLGSGPAQPWDPGADLMLGTTLFDFDLFSWDPSLLAPGWNANASGGGHT